jgi:hypothetical protein
MDPARIKSVAARHALPVVSGRSVLDFKMRPGTLVNSSIAVIQPPQPSMANPRPVSKKHTAPGQAAGYLFQPERALVCLAKAPSGAQIGVETDDDIAQQVLGATVERQQLKHTVSGKIPFDDHSLDLWKTLLIWLDAAAANEFDPNACDLLLVTNAELPDCFLRRLIDCNGGPKKIKACLTDFLTSTFPASVSDYVSRLKAHDPKLLIRVLARIKCADGRASPIGQPMRRKIASDLTLPDEVEHDVVIDAMLGWIHSVVLELWRAGRPAWIRKSAFATQLHRILRKLERYKTIGVPAHLINVPLRERRSQLNQMYVHQLRIVHAAERDVLNAIDDFYRCNIERLRLAQAGELTSEDWLDFEYRLKRYWELISGRESRVIPKRKPEDEGYAVFAAAIAYETNLAGDAPQSYLTSGSFHRLANSLSIGWHPDYETRCGACNGRTV